MRWVVVVLLVLLLVPGGSGLSPLVPLSAAPGMSVRAFVPPGGWPARIGALVPLGAVAIGARDRAFGGFSALAVRGDELLLLGDGGAFVRLAVARDGGVRLRHAGNLPAGPGTGRRREDRDAEAMARAADGGVLVAFERANAIWRYSPDLTAVEAHAAPAAMRGWGRNSGAESLVRLRDGRYLAIREGSFRRDGPRAALLFAGDPARRGTRVAALRYLPPPGTAPSDAALLPDGDLLVLNRAWRFPLRFGAVLVRVPAAAVRPGALLRGRVVARLGREIGAENAEGIAAAREGGRTIVWIVTDNDQWRLRRTILARFRLIE